MNKYFIIIILIFSSCKKGKDYKKVTISDISNKRIDTLKPLDNKSYYAYFIKVNGHVNDSVKIQRHGYFDITLTGKIDTILRGDYYGGENVICLFNPYKASKGQLEIEYSL
jgi:hypothetical protein